MLSRPARLALFAAGFALGGIPTARFVSRTAGVEIEAVGTGNPGAANVMRSVGKGAGALVLAGDAAKGAAPVLVARAAGADDRTIGVIALAPVLGHIALTGGRGVGAALGAAAAGDPPALTLVAPIFLVGTYRHVHAPSVLVTYVVFPLVRWRLGRSRTAVGWSAALMGLLALTRLRGAVHDRSLDRRSLWERVVHDRGPAGP